MKVTKKQLEDLKPKTKHKKIIQSWKMRTSISGRVNQCQRHWVKKRKLKVGRDYTGYWYGAILLQGGQFVWDSTLVEKLNTCLRVSSYRGWYTQTVTSPLCQGPVSSQGPLTTPHLETQHRCFQEELLRQGGKYGHIKWKSSSQVGLSAFVRMLFALKKQY